MSKRKSDKGRILSLKTELMIVKNDIAWIKKLGFGFFLLLAVNIIVSLLSLKPITEKLF